MMMPTPASLIAGLVAASAAATPAILSAQSQLDRADAIVAEESRAAARPATPDGKASPAVSIASTVPVQAEAVLVRAVRLDGLDTLRATRFDAAIAPFIGRTLDAGAQTDLLRALVAVARANGYLLATAMIPRQADVDGTLVIRFDEGRIGGLRFVRERPKLAEAIFAKLANGMPVTSERLTRALRLAEAIPGVRVRKIELVQERAINILSLDIQIDAIAGRVDIDNWGTRSIGPVLARGDVEARSVLASGDAVEVNITTAPFEPGEYQSFGGRYVLPLDANGTRLAVSANIARSFAPAQVRRPTYRGLGSRLGIQLTHPIVLGRHSLLRASVGTSFRTSETTQSGPRVRNDRVALVTGAIDGYALVGSGYLTGRLAVIHGPGWFGSTREGDTLASRSDGSAHFTKIEARAGIDAKLVGRLSVAFEGEAQVASRPLLFGDEFGIGGANFGRGYDFREKSGENAVAGSAEVRLDLSAIKLPVQRLVFYGYGDAARVWDLRSNAPSESLYSAGGGLRAGITRNFGLGLEIGVPLDRAQQPRGTFTTWLRF